jgi:hypothetical protein
VVCRNHCDIVAHAPTSRKGAPLTTLLPAIESLRRDLAADAVSRIERLSAAPPLSEG